VLEFVQHATTPQYWAGVYRIHLQTAAFISSQMVIVAATLIVLWKLLFVLYFLFLILIFDEKHTHPVSQCL
jgi:hypothetical protein